MPKSNSRRLDKDEKNVLLHLLQAPKLTNCDIARYVLSVKGTRTRGTLISVSSTHQQRSPTIISPRS